MFLFVIGANENFKICLIWDLLTFKVVAEVDSKFLSLAIGSRLVAENWKNFDFKSTKLLNMAKALSPAYFRLGGTSADLLYFKKHHKKAKMVENFSSNKIGAEENCECYEDLQTM